MISVVILTKNDEKHIVDCIDSLLWCDEIVVTDDYSSDMTLEAVSNINNPKIHIFQRKLGDDFSAQRNFALSKTTYDWILFVDSDEQVSTILSKEIQFILENEKLNPKYNGFYLRRQDTMWGHALKYGETSSVKLIRLGKKDSGKWHGKIHEEWKINGIIGLLENPLLHKPHQTVSIFLKEINRYTTLRAQELIHQKVHVSWWHIFGYPVSKFMLNYVFRLGFLDGTDGLVFALMMSFHSFLVRGKLWLYYKKEES